MKNSIIILAICLVTVGCSSTNYVTMSVLEPAPVTIPSYIKKVGIVDRSLPLEDSKQEDKLDQLLTIEGKDLDKEGAREAVRGVEDELSRNERFTEAVFIEDAGMRSAGMGVFPSPLSWDKVTSLCKKEGLDAIFTLEVYDTDTKINYSNQPVTIKGPMGIDIPAVEHHAHMITIVKAGWRIYDPEGKIILDEIALSKNIESSGKGINPAAATASLIGRKDAVKQVSYSLGQDFAYRILPYKVRVSRKYYVRGADNFKIAKRRAQTGNWDGAAELWEKELNNPKQKVAGRAHYNMAIICEINGNLEDAIEWAKKAYTDYRNKLALDYVNILEDRMISNSRLNEQMQE